MPEDEWVSLSRDICDKVIATNVWHEAKSVFLYNDYRNEVGTKMLFENAVLYGKKVGFPKSRIENGIPQMVFYNITDYSQFCAGYKDILEPNAEELSLEVMNTADLCVVPFVAANEKGYRIGYGKGFYDRFLCGSNVKNTIGIGFDYQICNDFVSDKYDIRLDMIITQSHIYER